MPKSERRFLVYAFLRSQDSKTGPRYSPYYIGKGTERRMFEKCGRIVPAPADPIYIVVIQDKLTEREAFNLEIFCIKLYGRVQTGTGILRNRTDGGDGPSGMIMSEETRKKMSEARRGEKHPLWGKPRPESVKKRISEANSGTNSPHYGKPLPEQTRKKIAAALKQKPKSDSHKQKLAQANLKYQYLLISPTGVHHEITNLYRFCKSNNLDPSTMRKAMDSGKAHKGWTGKILKELK